MSYALFLKEWLKLRLWWALLTAAATLAGLIPALRLRAIENVHGASGVWTNWIHKGWLFHEAFSPVPTACGLLLGVLQFLPELRSGRFRLALHLPLGRTHIILAHLFSGLFLLFASLMPGLGILEFVARAKLPAEYSRDFWLSTTPWLVSGVCAYLGVAATLLEPHWLRRLAALLFTAGICSLCNEQLLPASYVRVLPAMLLCGAAFLLLPLHAANRLSRGLYR